MQEVKTEIFDERAILVGVATQTVSEQKASPRQAHLEVSMLLLSESVVAILVQRL